MTLQWMVVAIFLYVEVGVLLLFCLPFISAKRWQSVFNLGIWNRLARFWNKFFLAMIIVLIVLFIDAVREMRKYSVSEHGKDSMVYPNAFDHRHMKLFRSHRNLYISGFSLFLWLVLRRVITLINQLAQALDTSSALKIQADGANIAATKYMEDNRQLKQALQEGKVEERSAEPKQELRSEVEKLSEELGSARDALKLSHTEMEAMRKQMDGLAKEYDRLLTEHQKLQNLQEDAGDKKDQ
ncbi:hypothetical protein AAFF_G00260690 [Aldrovandia affinis]|uniref:Endoplasmic reticulum transmembrane protein n=1 Tax=Aldrovandia affinis TaxID=143900 RepID=A0AAD7RBY0_9TELE|nr:hypothetical protein AAFF_G00260690 [Aldrovandia affinis]